MVNPVIPSGKYDGQRRGLGSLETVVDQKAKKAKSEDILQLPSYLRKRKKSPSVDPFIVGEILAKYKMSKSDLAIGKQSDHQYGYLNKVSHNLSPIKITQILFALLNNGSCKLIIEYSFGSGFNLNNYQDRNVFDQ